MSFEILVQVILMEYLLLLVYHVHSYWADDTFQGLLLTLSFHLWLAYRLLLLKNDMQLMQIIFRSMYYMKFFQLIHLIFLRVHF